MLGVAAYVMLIIAGGESFTWALLQLAISSHANHSFIHSIGMCRVRRFLAILRSFHPPSLHPAIYFLVYLLVLLITNSYTALFWEFYFLPLSML
jgi:hypothetical protein